MDSLEAFVKAAKEKGASDEFLVAMLRERGWPAKRIYSVLASHYAQATGVALPEAPGRMESAREAFFHSLTFATLVAWVFASGSIWFALIEAWFPDPLAASRRFDQQVSWEMAAIIVTFPAFLWATSRILRELRESPDKAASSERRWLTNLALFVTALIFIGDLVGFVSAFLAGGLTAPFALKSLVVSVLAGGVFLYYSRGLNKAAARAWHLPFAALAIAGVGVTMALGFWLNGSPGVQRIYAEDAERVRRIYGIAVEIHNTARGTPPANLDAIHALKGDPETGEPLEYRVVEGSRYEMCAAFGAESRPYVEGFWRHPAGQHCFAFAADSQPPYPTDVR